MTRRDYLWVAAVLLATTSRVLSLVADSLLAWWAAGVLWGLGVGAAVAAWTDVRTR